MYTFFITTNGYYEIKARKINMSFTFNIDTDGGNLCKHVLIMAVIYWTLLGLSRKRQY